MQNTFHRWVAMAAASLALLASTSIAIADAINIPPPRTVEPAATGQPHACANYYPQAALRMAVQGNTVLGFTVGVDGIPRDVSIATSSGNADLDEAAIACVKTWLYRPATRDGNPIAVPWKAQVAWSVQQAPAPATGTPIQTSATHTTPIGRPHTCDNGYPAAAIENMAQGTTTLQFTIGTDGLTHDISIYATSGNKDLDDAAVACASRWRYKPAVQDGKTVAVPWKANVAWRMPTLSLPVGFNPLAHQCAQAFLFAQNRHDGAFDLRLAFFVNPDGSVGAARVVRSSEDFELDSAFVKCVGSWEYSPAKRGETPVRVVWGALFHAAPQTGPATRDGPPLIHFCPSSSYVLRTAANGAQGTTVLNFQIDPSGHPEQIEIAESSGNSALDDAAKACAALWTYDIKGGQKSPLPWSAQIGWSADWWSIAAELGNGDNPAPSETTPPPARKDDSGI